MTRECGRCITMIACMMHFALPQPTTTSQKSIIILINHLYLTVLLWAYLYYLQGAAA